MRSTSWLQRDLVGGVSGYAGSDSESLARFLLVTGYADHFESLRRVFYNDGPKVFAFSYRRGLILDSYHWSMVTVMYLIFMAFQMVEYYCMSYVRMLFR